MLTIPVLSTSLISNQNYNRLHIVRINIKNRFFCARIKAMMIIISLNSCYYAQISSISHDIEWTSELKKSDIVNKHTSTDGGSSSTVNSPSGNVVAANENNNAFSSVAASLRRFIEIRIIL